MKRVNFLFGIHNHQPVGNFDFVIEDAFKKSYLPFIEVLERHPKIRIAIHFTGILLDWFKQNHPNYLPRIKKMVDRGQLEILTGAFYEPILAVIPEKDRQSQIQKQTAEIKNIFNYDAEGMWLAERIWEPTLASTLHAANIKYTILDDTHFKYAGLQEKDLTGYFFTEDLGKSVRLFPISKQLRYAIPFQEPQVTVAHLRAMATEGGGNIVVFADDGEKFGVWPKTFEHVYENGWLEKFFTVLEENLDWINLLHFKEAVNTIKPIRRIYLPTASYAEMGEWSLFPQAQEDYSEFKHRLADNGMLTKNSSFVRGGFWRNFQVKYREVNDMHKRMLHLSNKLWKQPLAKRAKLQKAFDHLWAAQCNCPYWHGVFGGIYLSHIRDAIYMNLIEAEKELERVAELKLPSLSKKDINIDGYDELLVKTKIQDAFFDLKNGGTMYELDFKPLSKNILDTMTRRREAYHKDLDRAVSPEEETDGTASIHDLVIAKEPDLKSKLFYDTYDRNAFIDHFIDEPLNPEDFAAAQYEEQGDFVQGVYHLLNHRMKKDRAVFTLGREGRVRGKKVFLQKHFVMLNDQGRISVEYSIENRSNDPVDTNFGVELNFGLQAGHAEDRYYYLKEGKPEDAYLDSRGIMGKADFIGLRDDWRRLDIRLSLDSPADIWRFPIETISLSEGGFERVYQSSAVVLLWKVQLDKKWTVRFELYVSTLSDIL